MSTKQGQETKSPKNGKTAALRALRPMIPKYVADILTCEISLFVEEGAAVAVSAFESRQKGF